MTAPFDQLAPWYDAIYAARGKDFDAEADAVVDLITAARGGLPPASLLDVACGTGSHLAAFARRVPVVAGLDAHPGMLAVARRRLPDVALMAADMRQSGDGPPVDAVTCLFAAIGYLPDEAALHEALAAMAGRLAPGGVLVIEPAPFPGEAAPPRRQRTLCTRGDQQLERITTAHREGDVLHINFTMRITAAGGEDTPPMLEENEAHAVRLFTAEAIQTPLRDAGLRCRVHRREDAPTRLVVGVAPRTRTRTRTRTRGRPAVSR